MLHNNYTWKSRGKDERISFKLTEGKSKSFWFIRPRTYSTRNWFAEQANWQGGVSVFMAATIVCVEGSEEEKLIY